MNSARKKKAPAPDLGGGDARQDEVLRRLPHRIIEAQEIERRRAARELHDGVSQILASVRFRCRDIAGRIGELADQRLRHDIRQMEKYLDAALAEVRNISHDLRPSELDDLGLLPAIESLVTHSRERSGLRIDLTLPRLRKRLPEEMELAIYRILQEAISNIERHASARTVNITLAKKPRSLLVSVEDDGRGFAASKRKKTGGLGLINMRERAEFIDATITFSSRSEKGTRLELFVPLPAK